MIDSIVRSKATACVVAAATIPMPLHLIGAHEAAASTRADRATPSESGQHAGKRHRGRHHRAGRRQAKRHHREDHARAGKLATHPSAPANKRRRATATSGNYGGATTTSRPVTSAAASGRVARHAARSAQDKSWRLAFPGARAAKRATARAASDPGDTISDFKFTPGTLTVHVGDSVTWTNDGPTDHTATANDGSFNTGTLKKGQSASHTFTKAGTFAYICAIHPFMHGTIVVQASSTTPTHTPSASSGGPGSSGSSKTATGSAGTTTTGSAATTSTGSAATTSTGSATTTASGPTLPETGLDLTTAVLLGLALLGAGLGLRRRVS
jgi:LPXTG-motif cell wall-anchored protein